MKKLQSFGENSHKCEADISFLGQYIILKFEDVLICFAKW